MLCSYLPLRNEPTKLCMCHIQLHIQLTYMSVVWNCMYFTCKWAVKIIIKSIQFHTTDIQSKVICDIQFFAWDCRYCPTTPFTLHICQLYVKLCMAHVNFCMCHIKLDIQLTYMWGVGSCRAIPTTDIQSYICPIQRSTYNWHICELYGVVGQYLQSHAKNWHICELYELVWSCRELYVFYMLMRYMTYMWGVCSCMEL